MKVFLLFCMIFCHIIDDYYLQGILINLKQRTWWEQNEPEVMYRHDYIVALLMHSFSWTFMVMLPISAYVFLFGGTWYPMLYLFNIIVHAVVDNAKANKRKINLLQDQAIHLIQIVVTWILWFFVYK